MSLEKKRELILAMLLGDGYILSKGFSLGIRHSVKQKDYLEWKVELINNNNIFKKDVKIRKEYTYLKETNKTYEQYVCRKQEKNILEPLYYLVYKNKKKDIIEVMKYIKSDLSLAIWFMDDGCVRKKKERHKDGSIYYLKPTFHLCTHSFTYEENIYLINWFNKKYKIKAMLTSETKSKTCKKYYYLRFNKDDSLKIYNIIRRYVLQIPSMREKFSYIENTYYNI